MNKKSKEIRKVPNLRFLGFEGEWIKGKLGDIGGVKMCRRIFNEETLPLGEIPFFKIGSFGKTADAFISRKLYIDYRKKFPFPNNGDILISAAGTIGRTVVYNGEDAYYQDSNIVWIDNDNSKVSNEFLYYILQIVKYHTEGGTIQRLYNNILKSTKFTYPLLNEQKKISAFLIKIDSRIQTQNKIIKDYKTLKKGMMQKIFKQEIRFNDENGNYYPKWKEKKLSELALIKTGSSNRQDSGLDGVYTFFDRSEDIRTSDIFLFDCEAIIVPGEGSDFVPKYFVGKFDLHQRTYAVMNFKGSVGKFIYFYIDYFRRYFLRQAVGSTVKSLRLPMFQKMNINMPCLEEQQKIASTLSAIDKKIALEEDYLDKLKAQKKYLLQNMFI